jgi:hypothetical protein
MSIFDNDTYLPGVITEIESTYSADYDTSLFGTTDSVVVVGTAFDGPTGELVPVYSKTHAAYLYGKSYDAVTRRECDLVAGICDAWDRGCRTIYGFRVNGIEMQKEFAFVTDTPYKLRVKSRYPSNLGKQVYLKYDNTPGGETMTIFKPASRSTIREKMNGLVESDTSVMVNEIRLAQDYAMTSNTKLVDAINIVNEHIYNNVLELAIVDADGKDVTTSAEAYDLTLGCVFPGVYFMGRSESVCTKRTDVHINLILDEDDKKPYTDFKGNYYRDLKFNSDVAAEYPIFYSDSSQMREVLLTANITMKEDDDYLRELGLSERAFIDDAIDYEESSLTPFELYKKLGEGYAVTAIAIARQDGNGNELLPKVKEANLDDPQRIAPVTEGAYSILQDAKIKYHVLASGFCADQEINGKLPKAAAFKTTLANSVQILNGLINVTPKVSEDDATAAKAYAFTISNYDLEANPISLSDENLYRKGIATSIGFVESEDEIAEITNAKPGDLVACMQGDSEAVLYIANAKGKLVNTVDKNYAGIYTEYTESGQKVIKYGKKLYVVNGTLYCASVNEDDETIKLESWSLDRFDPEDDKPMMLVESIGKLFLASVSAEQVTPICEYNVAVNITKDEDAEPGLFVFAADGIGGKNQISIQSINFDSLTLSDFVEELNESALSRLFDFKLTTSGIIRKDDYVVDADVQEAENIRLNGDANAAPVLDVAESTVLEADRKRGYDYSKHIPYYTTDNFARQLAQHCTYTELKTGPARGIIGCKRISDLSKTAIAKKVAEMRAKNWDLYAKTAYGRNMLNNNNLPYPIGRNVSICFFQNRVTTPSDYVQTCNGATAYAGMVSNLPLTQSSTSQTIDLTPMFELTHSQLIAMTQAGYVTVKNSFTKGYVITDGITMAPANDLLQRLFNTRVMGYVEDILRAACEPFIGKGNTIANRNALITAIDSGLSKITEVKSGNENTLLRSYDFAIRNDDTVEAYTQIDIDYTIVPVNEIRNIYNHITVTK